LFFEPSKKEAGALPPGEVQLRYHLLFTVAFHQDGIAGQDGGGAFEAAWSEVKEVRLVYFDHESHELCKIELDLPPRAVLIEGVYRVTTPAGSQRLLDSKAVPSVVGDYLEKYVPPEKLVRHALCGPPATLSECEHRMRKVQRDLRIVTWFYRILPAAMLLGTAGCFGPKLAVLWQKPNALPNIGWVLLLTVCMVSVVVAYPLITWALLREIRKRHAQSLRELAAWKQEHEREAQDSIRGNLMHASV
jgi:hypothetical protein